LSDAIADCVDPRTSINFGQHRRDRDLIVSAGCALVVHGLAPGSGS